MNVCKMGDALTHLPLHMQGRSSRLVGQIVTALQLWRIYSSSDMDLYSSRGECYSANAVTESSVCREARDGACGWYVEENSVDGGRHGTPVGVRAAKACTTQQNCETNMCEMVGTTEVCTQCNQGKVPIDGTCTAVDDTSKAKCKKDATTDLESDAQVCGACGDGYFLHKGGCYQFGGEVGKLICTDPSTSDGSLAAGTCTTCAPGYFKNPATAGAAVPPCITCNDTTGNNNNKGIGKCSTCTIESSGTTSQTAKCTKCQGTDYLKSDGTACGDQGTVCTSNTEFAKEDPVNGNRCVPCGDTESGVDGCAKCTAPSGESTKPTCTECNNNKIVKTEPSGTSCVEEAACVDGFFVETVSGTPSKKCTACADNNCAVCTAAGTGKCSKCKDSFNLGGGKCMPPNTNRSALSTGAIAGISVAVIVIVGGLVGFLCWWFLCRGKA